MITPFRLFLSITCSPDFLLDFFSFIEFIDSNFNVDPFEKIEFERCFRPLSKEFFYSTSVFFFDSISKRREFFLLESREWNCIEMVGRLSKIFSESTGSGRVKKKPWWWWWPSDIGERGGMKKRPSRTKWNSLGAHVRAISMTSGK